MMYKKIDCPTCGNETIAKSVREPQKCKWCRRLFKVNIVKRNKESKKAKFNWNIEPIDFDTEFISKTRNLNDYENEDVYGKLK